MCYKKKNWSWSWIWTRNSCWIYILLQWGSYSVGKENIRWCWRECQKKGLKIFKTNSFWKKISYFLLVFCFFWPVRYWMVNFCPLFRGFFIKDLYYFFPVFQHLSVIRRCHLFGMSANQRFHCNKHFEESDFVYHTNDTNNRMKWKLKKEKLKYKYMWKMECIQQISNLLFIFFKKEVWWKTFLSFLSRKREDFSSKIRK